MKPGSFISVVVPLAPGEEKWKELLPQLLALGPVSEIIFSATETEPQALSQFATQGKRVAWLDGPRGRAKQQNAGASKASGDFVWFLHADSNLSDGTNDALKRFVQSPREGLRYFDLSFTSDDHFGMRLNEVGARFRSRVLGLPFGDQGFLLAKETFVRLGGFDESAPYGEDHLLVWKAHFSRVSVRPIGCEIGTSARKYRARGWLRTTGQHLWLTAKQATPEFLKFVKTRIGHEARR